MVLPVLHYPKIGVNYRYPFWGVILHDFIRKTTIENSQTVTIFPLYGKL